MDYSQKKIKDLVAEHYVFASVLYYLGIAYYDFEEDSLEIVCKQKGLNCAKVVEELEQILHNEEFDKLKLMGLPTDLIVEYLKHAHFIFIKKDLPFLVRLINQLQAATQQYFAVQKDLKDVFPLFVEDFVHHIYEEEDTLFDYILNLNKVKEGKLNPSKFFYQHRDFNIQKFAMDHEVHDDEMRGIRFIMEQFPPEEAREFNFNVLQSELKRFEEKLVVHASIENEILFPKALMLEKQVKRKFEEQIKFN